VTGKFIGFAVSLNDFQKKVILFSGEKGKLKDNKFPR
jgi:hypothetical protein